MICLGSVTLNNAPPVRGEARSRPGAAARHADDSAVAIRVGVTKRATRRSLVGSGAWLGRAKQPKLSRRVSTAPSVGGGLRGWPVGSGLVAISGESGARGTSGLPTWDMAGGVQACRCWRGGYPVRTRHLTLKMPHCPLSAPLQDSGTNGFCLRSRHPWRTERRTNQWRLWPAVQGTPPLVCRRTVPFHHAMAPPRGS
jgi:hypothetical protein